MIKPATTAKMPPATNNTKWARPAIRCAGGDAGAKILVEPSFSKTSEAYADCPHTSVMVHKNPRMPGFSNHQHLRDAGPLDSPTIFGFMAGVAIWRLAAMYPKAFQVRSYAFPIAVAD